MMSNLARFECGKISNVALLLALAGFNFLVSGCQPGLQDEISTPAEVNSTLSESTGQGSNYGNPTDGVVSRIWSDRAVFSVGEAVPVNYAIKNTRTTEVTIWHSGFWPNNFIDVTDSGGEPVAVTPLGEQMRSAFSPTGAREKNAPKILKSGDVDDAWKPYDLTKYFDLAIPGEYKVQYTYDDSQSGLSGPVASNTLHLTITQLQ